MRLDKFLSDMNMGTRTELKRDIRKGAVQVNGEKITDPGFMVNEMMRLFCRRTGILFSL